MTGVGIFAGRGDVIVALFLAILVGAFIGWYLRKFYVWVTTRFEKKEH